MNCITKDIENWITGVRYCKFKKDKKHNDLEYKELNRFFKPKSRKQWTNEYGEAIVRFLLEKLDYKVNKNKSKIKVGNNTFIPDIETDDAIWEVKTRNWTTAGTAGEKVLGTPVKYSDLPTITNKPLYIVTVAYQEYECDKYFNLFLNENDDRLANKRKILDIFNSLNIYYIRCSDLLYRYFKKETTNEISKNIKKYNQ